MSGFKFDIGRLNSIIADSKAKSGGGDKKEFTNVGYLPEGTHKVRIFFDPDQNLYRDLKIFQGNGKKCLCPDVLNRENSKNPEWTKLPDCEITPIAKEINSWKSGLDLKFRTMIYMAVYETTAASDYWKADKQNGVPYAVVGKTKMRTAVMQMLETFAADAPDYVLQMLNPELAGGLLSITVTGGTQGSVSITAIPGATKPAIFEPGKAPEWYRPLNQVFIKPEFNQDAYDEFLKIARDKLKEHRAKIAAGQPVHTNEQDAKPADNSAASSGAVASQTANVSTTPEQTSSQQVNGTQEPSTAAGTTQVETSAGPVTTTTVVAAETPAAAEAGLAAHQRRTKMGRVVDLTPEILSEGCWMKYDAAQPKCMTCAVNIECMTEQAS